MALLELNLDPEAIPLVNWIPMLLSMYHHRQNLQIKKLQQQQQQLIESKIQKIERKVEENK